MEKTYSNLDRLLAVKATALELVAGLFGPPRERAFDVYGFTLSAHEALLIWLIAKISARPIPVSRLARAIAVEQPTVSALLSRLVNKGIVTTAEDPADRRARRVTLTQRGEEVLSLLLECDIAADASWAMQEIASCMAQQESVIDELLAAAARPAPVDADEEEDEDAASA